MPASATCSRRSRRPDRERRGDVAGSARQLRRGAAAAARACAPSAEPLDRGRCSTDARPRAARGTFDPDVGRLRRRAEVPAGLDARVPAPDAPPRRRHGARDGREDARRDGRRRDVRPGRRRLPPLLGRRALARPALREDALRQRPARHGVPARLGRHRRRALPADRRRDARLRAARAGARPRAASPRRRTPTPTASRASRSRGPRRGRRPRSCCIPSSTAASIIRGELDDASCARGCFEVREQRPKPLRDDKAIASWNGLILAALAEAGRRLGGRDYVEAAARLGEFLLGRSRTTTAASTGATARGRRRAPGSSTTTPTSRTACYELHVATGELRWLRGGAPARAARGRALRGRASAAGSSSRRATASS